MSVEVVAPQQENVTNSPAQQQLGEELQPLTQVSVASVASSTGKPAANGNFPPPKSDKPRPHVCNTCGRSFARLEHLKRHERSHTKEKPFECPECTRCFARRDLLLRHQQKLHMTAPSTSRPRNARRESMGGPGAARVRKNSMATPNLSGPTNMGGVRPRANTISHVDLQTMGMANHVNGGEMNGMSPFGLGIGFGNGNGNMPGKRPPFPPGFDQMNGGMNGMQFPNNAPVMQALPKLNTDALGNTFTTTDTLHTAPAMANFGGFDFDQLMGHGSTINPSQLHVGASTPGSMTLPQMPTFGSQPAIIEDDGDMSWMRNWSMQSGLNLFDNENAIDESSPSRMSSGDSPAEQNDSLVNSTSAMPVQSTITWSPSDMHNMPTTPFIDSLGNNLANLNTFGTSSPTIINDPTPTPDNYFHAAMAQQRQSQNFQQPQPMQPQQQDFQQMPMQGNHAMFPPGISTMSNFSSESPSMSSSSMNGSARQSSVSSVSTDSITDATRQALLASLAQPSVFGRTQRKYSQPSVSSPLSPGGSRLANPGLNLPSTADLRRYVEAFFQFALPHMPLVHVPTLSFDSLEFCSSIRSTSGSINGSNNAIMGGAGCLILAMAAMGALYEYDHPASRDLFEASKKMIGLYLEERRKADITASVTGNSFGHGTSQQTPLWLVQAMLLNVIYGHQCGDKIAADIASNHCAALVSLARAADLADPVESSFSQVSLASCWSLVLTIHVEVGISLAVGMLHEFGSSGNFIRHSIEVAAPEGFLRTTKVDEEMYEGKIQ